MPLPSQPLSLPTHQGQEMQHRMMRQQNRGYSGRRSRSERRHRRRGPCRPSPAEDHPAARPQAVSHVLNGAVDPTHARPTSRDAAEARAGCAPMRPVSVVQVPDQSGGQARVGRGREGQQPGLDVVGHPQAGDEGAHGLGKSPACRG